MLSETKGKRLDCYVPDYVVFDLETTGVSSSRDDIVEISAVAVENGKVISEFSTLINPGRHIPEQVSWINGIDDGMVEDAPVFEEVLPEFLNFIGDRVLAGHNIQRFDMLFLYRECERIYGLVPDNDFIDTLPIARMGLPEMTHHSLSDLASYYGISTRGAHRALNDCRMNQKVLEHLFREPALQQAKRCPKCGKIMKQRSGKFGEFWGCTGYPNCRYTENIRSTGGWSGRNGR